MREADGLKGKKMKVYDTIENQREKETFSRSAHFLPTLTFRVTL